ncbi:GIY-YIG nuclease family protein [Streptomyces canus]|uniref:GIY-YIG nuclease family protein n=1 Tax=Streptomyces canus TaxID=58343 RepID=UPI00386A9D55
MIHRATGDEVAVYRLFADSGQLLYVGISKDPMNRWQEHSANSWWRRVASYEVRWHPTRAEARAEEKEAMASESPVHNIHSAPRHGSYWRAALNTPEAVASRAARAQQIAKGMRGSKRPKAEETSDG